MAEKGVTGGEGSSLAGWTKIPVKIDLLYVPTVVNQVIGQIDRQQKQSEKYGQNWANTLFRPQQ